MDPELESGSPVLLAGLLLSSECLAGEPGGSRCPLQGLLPQVGLLGEGLCLCFWFMGMRGGGRAQACASALGVQMETDPTLPTRDAFAEPGA